MIHQSVSPAVWSLDYLDDKYFLKIKSKFSNIKFGKPQFAECCLMPMPMDQ